MRQRQESNKTVRDQQGVQWDSGKSTATEAAPEDMWRGNSRNITVQGDDDSDKQFGVKHADLNTNRNIISFMGCTCSNAKSQN